MFTKIMAVMSVACLAFCGTVLSFSADTSVAEDDSDSGVAGGFTVMLGEEEVDAFEYLGIIYALTNDEEDAMEVGVYGTSDESSVDGHYVCVNSFEYDEGTYAVTSVLNEFKDNASGITGSSLALAVSISDYAEGCFEGLGLHGIVVGPEVDDEMMMAAGLSEGDYTILDDDSPTAFDLTASAGDMNSNIIANYNGGEGVSETGFYAGITTVVESVFEYPGFDFAGYLDADDNEIPADAQAVVIGGVLYIDGEAYSGSADVTAQWEENTDYLAEYEIEIALPFLSFGTITGTYEMWMMYATVLIIVLAAVAGISMFTYRKVMARKG